MFTKIIKRGHRKFSKSDASDVATLSSGLQNSTSVVTVNFASRPIVVDEAANGAASAAAGMDRPSLSSGDVEMLPLFRDVPVSDREALFIRKLHVCTVVFDFSDTMKYAKEKEIKRQMLLDLVEFIQSGLGKMTEKVQEEMIGMISVNIFRCMPPAPHEYTKVDSGDGEEDESYLEPSWPHLHIVYELLLRYIVSPDTDLKIAKRYIDSSFVMKLIDLFDSEDPREREYLKTVLHRIYGKFMVHRPFIRKGINNIFFRFILETERHNGIGELLEILGSIINGFAMPMKEEHKLFLVRVLIPLHKPKMVALYHQQLSYCITQFVEKDCKLADTIIWGLLKYWPITSYQKELLFLAELEEVLDSTQSAELHRCMVPLFRQIGRCVTNSHFQVAERALFLWNNDHIVTFMAQNRNVIFPIMYEALEKNIRSHWSRTVQELTANVQRMLFDMDNQLFEKCQRHYLEKESRESGLEQRRELTWKRLEEEASH